MMQINTSPLISIKNIPLITTKTKMANGTASVKLSKRNKKN